jgi:hypothetical protein
MQPRRRRWGGARGRGARALGRGEGVGAAAQQQHTCSVPSASSGWSFGLGKAQARLSRPESSSTGTDATSSTAPEKRSPSTPPSLPCSAAMLRSLYMGGAATGCAGACPGVSILNVLMIRTGVA